MEHFLHGRKFHWLEGLDRAKAQARSAAFPLLLQLYRLQRRERGSCLGFPEQPRPEGKRRTSPRMGLMVKRGSVKEDISKAAAAT